MTLSHDLSRRAKKARLLVVGERCYVLVPQNKWVDTFVTGITDSGRSYDTQVEATSSCLRRNHSHIRPKSPDIPMLHASFLQQNSVSSVANDTNTPSTRENSVISAWKQLAGTGQKMVLSEPCRGSIKQTNTFQVLVSETVPQRRVQLSRQTKKTRFEDNPVSSTVTIPARQPGYYTSTRNRRKFKTGCDWPRSAYSNNKADQGKWKAFFRPERATTVIQWLSTCQFTACIWDHH